MSAYLYDEALVSRLRKITDDQRIHIIPPEQMIDFTAQVSEDKVVFPAISLVRRGVTLLDYRNQVAALKGETAYIDSDNLIHKMRVIPMRIDWDINVYTVDRYSCDEIIRELVFYFITYPRFEVDVPYDINVPQNFDVFLSNDIVDNSDLLEFPNRGEYFRETISVWTENAHMFSTKLLYPVYSKVFIDDKFIKDNHKLCEGNEMNAKNQCN